eukprot:m.838810 g.838810  ORF g.838810 m.838810 type:complete len:55 (-) comp59500_c0_seq35:2238-2402(-)
MTRVASAPATSNGNDPPSEQNSEKNDNGNHAVVEAMVIQVCRIPKDEKTNRLCP